MSEPYNRTPSAVPLAPRKKKGVDAHGDPLESTIQADILRALQRIEGVQAWRQNTGRSPCACGACKPKLCRSCAMHLAYPIQIGLCDGSADIIGEVSCALFTRDGRGVNVGRFFAIEVKRPGNRPTDDQKVFAALVRRFGGAATDECTNVADAVAFIHRAQRCEDL